jgi:hypothetical protein
MAGTALREASRLFNLMRAREIQRTAQHTLDEIATRFPAHLIDDVNARGLPPDRMLDEPGLMRISQPVDFPMLASSKANLWVFGLGNARIRVS